MPRAVVILPSTTYRADDFVKAAEALGIDLVVVSEQPPPFDMGDRYVRVDCSDPHAAAELVAALGDEVALDGVVAADDGGVLIAAIVGSKLGLHANHPDAAAATRDKEVQRRRFETAEVPQPRFAVVTPGTSGVEGAVAVGFPLVVKPTTRSASQGVVRATDVDELRHRIHQVRDIVGEGETLLLEEFMEGAEVAVEGLMVGGELTVLTIFDKPDTSDGPTFAETILVTPSRHSDEDQTEMTRVAAAAVRALGITHGPVHVELKVDNGSVGVIEVAARSIGGLCSRSLNFGLMGTTLESLILRNAIGLDKPELRRESLASGVLMIPVPRSGILGAISGVETAREIPGVTGIDLMVQPGSIVLAPPEGDRYLGFVFARGETPEAVESALRTAMSTITVEVG
jgi:biotin carboxylase